MIAVCDGLGHGEEAAHATGIALDTIETVADFDVERILDACHGKLRGTRGVAMSVAVIDEGEARLTWAGVGNVEGRLIRPGTPRSREAIVLRGGIVGYQLPPIRLAVHPVRAGDTLIFATDGVDSSFADDPEFSGSVETNAQSLLRKHFRGTDDALVLVARLVGRP